MSELINNREYRQKVLKELISELHRGKSVEEISVHIVEKLVENFRTGRKEHEDLWIRMGKNLFTSGISP